jgi:hypothetical protein
MKVKQIAKQQPSPVKFRDLNIGDTFQMNLEDDTVHMKIFESEMYNCMYFSSRWIADQITYDTEVYKTESTLQVESLT